MATKMSDTEMRQAIAHQKMRSILTIAGCGAICVVLGIAYAVV